jgi:integrase/recombinase XerD
MSPLRRRMIDDMQIRNLTPNTQRVYIAQVVRFACHFHKSPELLGPADIRTYLIHLTQERRLSASSIIVAVSALGFSSLSPSNGRGLSKTTSPPAVRRRSFPSC